MRKIHLIYQHLYRLMYQKLSYDIFMLFIYFYLFYFVGFLFYYRIMNISNNIEMLIIFEMTKYKDKISIILNTSVGIIINMQ
jgi:hypothetical protein